MDNLVDNKSSKYPIKQAHVPSWTWVFLSKACPREKRSAIAVRPWYKHAILFIQTWLCELYCLKEGWSQSESWTAEEIS